MLRRLITTILICTTRVCAQVSPNQCEPAATTELRSDGGMPAPDAGNAQGSYSKEFFRRAESPKRTACQLAEKTLVEHVLGHRRDLCNPGMLLKDSLARKMQLNQGIEFDDIGGGYFFNEGCMAHNCPVKAFTVMDPSGIHGVIGILDCKLSPSQTTRVKNDPYWLQVLYLYSDFESIDEMPDVVRRKIKSWVDEQQRAERASIPNAAISIVKLP
jgi:hypothetical protein